MPPPSSDPQARALLAPGLRVVRRGLDHLQVGLYDDRRILLPRTQQVERALASLLERRPALPDPPTDAVLDLLDRHGCLTWTRAAPTPRPSVALLGRLEVPGVPDVGVLLGAGATLTTTTSEADVAIVLSAGELDRDRLDGLVRAGTTHVVVRLVDGGVVLGPFVVPGATACVRCIDAQRSVADPDHLAVTTRYVRATARPRVDGVCDVDPVVATIALAWAVRDVLAHLAGHEPSTWSRTLFLGAHPSSRSEQEWPRHPGCGCCW